MTTEAPSIPEGLTLDDRPHPQGPERLLAILVAAAREADDFFPMAKFGQRLIVDFEVYPQEGEGWVHLSYGVRPTFGLNFPDDNPASDFRPCAICGTLTDRRWCSKACHRADEPEAYEGDQ